MKHDAIIIGGGAAGLFCAYQAAKLGSNVVVLDIKFGFFLCIRNLNIEINSDNDRSKKLISRS